MRMYCKNIDTMQEYWPQVTQKIQGDVVDEEGEL